MPKKFRGDLTDRQRAAYIRTQAKRNPGRWAGLARKRGMTPEELIDIRTVQMQRWCPGCSTWKKWSEFWKGDSYEGRASRCAACTSRKAYKRRPWTKEEVLELYSRIGKEPTDAIAASMRRSRSAIVNKATKLGISMRGGNDTAHTVTELCGLFSCSTWVFDQWLEFGLVSRKVNRDRVIEQRNISLFFMQRPEAYDYLENPKDVPFDLLEIDPDALPEPPSFKLVFCSGESNGEQKHAAGMVTVELYSSKANGLAHCPLCGKVVTRWASAYVEEYPGDGPFASTSEVELAPGLLRHVDRPVKSAEAARIVGIVEAYAPRWARDHGVEITVLRRAAWYHASDLEAAL